MGDTPPDLILDVTRFANGDPAETRDLVVAWERADLEELLRQGESDRVILTFDSDAIREAMEADVEAHGIREKVLVLAVAAVQHGRSGNASGRGAPTTGRSRRRPASARSRSGISHGTLRRRLPRPRSRISATAR